MIAHMKKLVSGLKDVNEELSRAATDMSAASSHFLATSQDIQNQVGEMRQGIEKLDESSEGSRRAVATRSRILAEHSPAGAEARMEGSTAGSSATTAPRPRLPRAP